MPSFIAAVVAALLPAGVSLGVANAITAAVFVAASVGLAVGAVDAIAQALKTPKPDALHEVVRQPTPPRRRGCGTDRLGGNYLLDHANNTNDLFRVIAFVDGVVRNITRYYLAQDWVRLTGNVVNKTGAGAYGNSQVAIDTAFGEHGVYAFSRFGTKIAAAWPSNSYGTGIFMGATSMFGGALEHYQTNYPRGKAALNIVGEVNVAYDWRDEAQSQTDPATWQNTANPIIAWVHELWAFRGYDWATDFLPSLAILTAEADACDYAVARLNIFAETNIGAVNGSAFVYVEPTAAVPPNGTTLYVGGQSFTVSGAALQTNSGVETLKISFTGGTLDAGVGVQQQVRWQATPDNPVTEKRYSVGGSWLSSETEADTVKRFADACDGWSMRRGSDGAMIIRCGRYYEPTVTLGPDEVISYTWQPYIDQAKAVTELVPSFVAPEWDYTQIDTTPWQASEDDLGRYGLASQPFQPELVQSNGQVRRLAKARLSRLLSHSEVFTFKISALRALGERFVRLQLGDTESDDLADIVMEVVGDIEIVNGGMEITIPLAPVDPARWDWDAYTEEGDGPAVTAPGTGAGALDPPTITAADIETRGVTTGGVSSGDVLVVDISPPADVSTRADLTYFVQWRIVGSANWNPLGPFTDLGAGDVEVDTPFVPTDQSIELQARYATGGGRYSDWSASFTAGSALTTEAGDHLAAESGALLEPDTLIIVAAVLAETGDKLLTDDGAHIDYDA